MQFLEKNIENVEDIEDIKLVTTETRRNYLVLELNYNNTKYFSENLLVIEMRKTRTVMNNGTFNTRTK